LNLNKLYEDFYLDGKSMEDILQTSKELLSFRIPDEAIKLSENLHNYDMIKDKLFARVCSVERNRELLNGIPHMVREDLAVTYGIIVDDHNGLNIAKINYDMLGDWGITAEELHRDAMENSEKFTPARVESMFQALGMDDPEEEQEEPDLKMFIVTNEMRLFGATSLFYEGVMEKVAGRVHGDYYILPSSIHEMIIVPDNADMTLDGLESMVKDANSSILAEQDILTDTVYHYDATEKVFEKARGFVQRKAELTTVILPGKYCSQKKDYVNEGKTRTIFTFPKGTIIDDVDVGKSKVMLPDAEKLDDGSIRTHLPKEVVLLTDDAVVMRISPNVMNQAIGSIPEERSSVAFPESALTRRPEAALEI
jgi:hypothetical protein